MTNAVKPLVNEAELEDYLSQSSPDEYVERYVCIVQEVGHKTWDIMEYIEQADEGKGR